MRIISLIAITFLIACSGEKKNKNCIFHISDLNKSLDRVVITDSLNGGVLMRDKGDGVTGGEYVFFGNGKLRSYKFFANSNAYSYNEEYGLDGKLIKMEGFPLVNKKVKEINNDSANFKFYFFSVNKEYQNLHVYINDTQKIDLVLKGDSLYSNMQYASFGLNTSQLKDIDIYIDVNYKNTCTGLIESFKDTLSLMRTVNKTEM